MWPVYTHTLYTHFTTLNPIPRVAGGETAKQTYLTCKMWLLYGAATFVGLVGLVSVLGRRWNARGAVLGSLPAVDYSSAVGKGQTAIVTGGNAGLGLEMCRGLLRLGYRVIMATRGTARGQRARDQLLREELDARGTIEVVELDLESFDSVRTFAETRLTAIAKVDVLICNAGVWANVNP